MKKTLDCDSVARDLDSRGAASIAQLITPDECRSLAELYGDDERFRSRVVMARHGFGRGEYKYFAYPLPQPVARLRTSLYPHLASIANRWNEQLRIDTRFPKTHAEFLERCHEAGQDAPDAFAAPVRRRADNCLHQDLYGEHVFPLQVDDSAFPAGKGLRRRRVRAHGAAAPHAIPSGGGATSAGGCGDLRGSSPTGAGLPGSLSGEHAPRRQPRFAPDIATQWESSSTTRADRAFRGYYASAEPKSEVDRPHVTQAHFVDGHS